MEGWSRALHAPWIAGGLLGVVLLIALPPGPEIHVPVPTTQPSSFVLIGAFAAELRGYVRTLSSAMHPLDADSATSETVRGVIVYVAVWLFVAGGVADRLARGRPIGTGPFFAACGVYSLRLLRLTMVLLPVLAGLVLAQRTWLPRLLENLAGLPAMTAGDAAFLMVSMAVSLVLDFSVVRMVVEDRRSAIGALAASTRFIRRRPLRVLALYLLNVAVGAVVWQLWVLVIPIWTLGPLLLSALMMLLYVWTRLAFVASELVFFQNELAHAHYTAAPVPTWPESAAVEAIENLARRRNA